MVSLITDKSKTVELFIENLLWGRVAANFWKYLESKKEVGGQEYVEDTYMILNHWIEYKSGDTSFVNEEDFADATEKLYNAYVQGRIDGTITGELIDEKHEVIVRKLKKEIEDCKAKHKELEAEKVRLTADNITLANELADRQHIIDTYEKAAGYKKDGK